MSLVIGVLGTGYISRFHFDGLAQAGVRVAMIAEVERRLAEPALQRFQAIYTADWRTVLAQPEIQAVCVFTPSGLHYEQVKAALLAGKHVICEKTLTLSPVQSLELGHLAKSRGLCLYTSYMKRFFPAVRQAHALLPRLGKLTSVYCRTYQPVGHDFHTQPAIGGFALGADGQSSLKRKYGGGVLVCGGSHIFDLLLYLAGQPTSIYGRRFQRPETDIDMNFHCLLDLPHGAVGHFEANWHPLNRVGFEGRGWDEGFELSGTQGRLILETPVWDFPERNAARLRHYDNATGHWTDYRFDAVNAFAEAEKHFLNQIEAGQQGPQDPYTGYRVDYLLAMAARSADLHQPLPLHFEA